MILQRLRSETASHHAAIESQMPLLDPEMSLETYIRMLQSFWGYYSPLEERLRSQSFAGRYVWSDRKKTPRLMVDLLALGASTTEIARCEHLPCLDSIAEVLGCLYVIEGASLGGQIIAKHLNANLGLTPETGASFFGGYGVNTGPYWLAFRTLLTEVATSVDQDDQIVISANATFQTLCDWLSTNQPTSLNEPSEKKR
jgi:heme oxygenase